MSKKREENARIMESVVETARMIFRSCERLGIIFLLTEKEMNIQELQGITRCSESLITHHLTELERGGIIKGKDRVNKKGAVETFFKVNKDIRDDLVQIINSFLSIQDILKKYKQNAVLEKHKKEKTEKI